MKMITTGDIKISVLVDKATASKALRAVHQAFAPGRAAAGAGRPADGRTRSPSRRRPAAIGEPTTWPLSQRLASMEDIVVSDVLLDTDQGRITIFDLPDRPGNCSRVFQAVASGGIVVDMIVQNLTEPGRAELSFSVPRGDLERAAAADAATWSRRSTRHASVAADADIARLFVSGVGMRTHTGVARAMFGALAERGINIA